MLQKLSLGIQGVKEQLEGMGRELYTEDNDPAKSATKTVISVHAALSKLQKEIRVACTEGIETGEKFSLEEVECELTDADTKKLERIKKEIQQSSPAKGYGGYTRKRPRADKSQSQCYGCGNFGHYRTDPECPYNSNRWAPIGQHQSQQ